MQDPQTPNAEPQMPEPVAYLYSDSRVPQDVHPWLHSTMLTLASDRRPELNGETALITTESALRYAEDLAAHRVAEAVAAERERCADLCEGMNIEDGPYTYARAIRNQPPATGKEQA